jgi:hypothetical protein
MRTRKSWQEKLDNPKLPKLVPVPPKMRKRFGNGVMLVPSPRDVEAVIRSTPEGSVITVSAIRRALAEKYSADVTCPLATGILIRIVAEAAEEELRSGAQDVAPYWRVVKDGGRSTRSSPAASLVRPSVCAASAADARPTVLQFSYV